MRKSILFISLLLFSCSNNDNNIIENDYVENVVVTFEPMDDPIGTRTQMSVVGGRTFFKFFSSDIIGFFSCLDNQQQSFQMAFPINDPSGEGVSSFTFDGGGWRMLNAYSYTAYVPFEYDNKDATMIPVSFLKQKQVGNDDARSLTPFLTSNLTQPVDNYLAVSMVMRNALGWIKVNIPEPCTLKKAVLFSEEEDFIVSSHFNLMSNPQAFIYTNDKKAQTITLSLENVATTSSNQEVNLYMCLCPTSDLVGKNLKLVIENESGDTYVGSFVGANLKMGGGALISPTLAKTPQPFNLPMEEGLDGITGSAPDFIPVGE